MGDHYNTHREAAAIFHNRNDNSKIQQSTFTGTVNKFKTSGSCINSFNKKGQKFSSNEDQELERSYQVSVTK